MSYYDLNLKNMDSLSHVSMEINNPYDYHMIKNKKKVHNIRKSCLYKHSVNKMDDYIILPVSSYNPNMFSGSS